MLGTRTTVATVSTRPRLECPACGRIVAATSVDTRYGPIEEVAWRGELVYGLCPHNDPNGHRCEGVSVFLPVATTPAPDTCAARLTVNLVPAAQWGANLSQVNRPGFDGDSWVWNCNGTKPIPPARFCPIGEAESNRSMAS